MNRQEKNPLTNCKVVGEIANPNDHVSRNSAIKRGDPRFVMSRSELMRFAACPRKWIAGLPEPEPTAAMKFGSAVDCLFLTPSKFEHRYAVAPETYVDDEGKLKIWNYRSRVCQSWRDAEESKGKEVITAEQNADIYSAFKSLGDSALSIRTCSKAQVLVLGEYRHKATGLTIPLAGLIDLVPDEDDEEYGKCLIDLKTASTAEPDQWEREIHKYGYDMQAALYLDMYVAATGEDRCEFLHIVVENEPPWLVAFRSMTNAFIEPGSMTQEFVALGRMRYLRALDTYCHCLKTGEWPEYPPKGRLQIGNRIFCEPQAWMVNK